MNTNIVLVDGFKFEYREDNYINLTLMCKQVGKKVNNYLSSEQTKAYLKNLSLSIGVKIENLLLVKKGGNNKSQGTWGHIMIALHLAQWLSPEITIKFYKVLTKVFEKDFLQFNKESYDKDKEGYIYLINQVDTNLYKIGYTKNLIKRLSNLQTANAIELIIKERYFSPYAKDLEILLHNYYASSWVRGEWFELSTYQSANFLNVAISIDKDIENDSYISLDINSKSIKELQQSLLTKV